MVGLEVAAFERRWLSDAEAKAWQHFWLVTQRLEQHLDRRLRARHGLSHVQYEILVRLADATDGAVRMSELADKLVTAKSAITYQVGRLVDRGLLRRSGCPTDSRGVYAAITDAGRTLLDRAAPEHLATVRACYLEGLSCEQVGHLNDMLGTWCANITADTTD